MTIQSRPLILSALLALAMAAPASAACVPGGKACPAVVHMQRGATAIVVKGQLTKARPIYYFTFGAHAGQKLTIDIVKDPGIAAVGGIPISFPGGKGSDAIYPGDSFTLPSDGDYVMELHGNRRADAPLGAFVVNLTIR